MTETSFREPTLDAPLSVGGNGFLSVRRDTTCSLIGRDGAGFRHLAGSPAGPACVRRKGLPRQADDCPVGGAWPERRGRSVIHGVEGASKAKTLSYDFARQLEGATKVKISGFGDTIIAHMEG